MKTFVTLLLVALVASTALAGIDPDTDSMGIYFDTAGNEVCRDWPMFTPLSCYLLLANPSAPVCGFECRVRLVGGPYFALSTTLPPGALDVDASAEGFVVGGTSPFPPSGGPVVLVTWSLMLQSAVPLRFYVSGVNWPGIDPWPTVGCSGASRRCGVSSGDVNLPVAAVNAGCGIVSTTISSFGAIKGLYR